MSIPHALRFVWLGSEIPDWVRANIDQWHRLNPGYAITIYDDDRELPSELRPMWDAISGDHLWARRSDVLRVAILRKHGGWYFDTDFCPVRPLDELYEQYGGFPRGAFATSSGLVPAINAPQFVPLDQIAPKWFTRTWVANGAVGTEPESQFIDTIYRRIIAKGTDRLSWGTYGPVVFTEQYEFRPNSIHLGPQEDWYRSQSAGADAARLCHARLLRDKFSHEAMVRELGKPLPFADHGCQQSKLELPEL